jgi:SH3-like domain-containing protein
VSGSPDIQTACLTWLRAPRLLAASVLGYWHVVRLFLVPLAALAATPSHRPLAASPQKRPRCEISAYTASPDQSAANLRAAADVHSRIIARIPADTLAVATLTDQRGGWFRVSQVVDAEHGDHLLRQGAAWIHQTQIGLSVAGGFHWLRRAPSRKGRPVMRLTPDGNRLELIGCQGRWVKVRVDGRRTGWIPPEAQCSNPMTSCS